MTSRVAGNREATLRGCVRELLPGDLGNDETDDAVDGSGRRFPGASPSSTRRGAIEFAGRNTGGFVGEGNAGESHERRLVASCLSPKCLPGRGVDVEVA